MTLSGRTNVSIKKEKNLDKITLRKKYSDNLDLTSQLWGNKNAQIFFSTTADCTGTVCCKILPVDCERKHMQTCSYSFTKHLCLFLFKGVTFFKKCITLVWLLIFLELSDFSASNTVGKCCAIITTLIWNKIQLVGKPTFWRLKKYINCSCFYAIFFGALKLWLPGSWLWERELC